MPLQLVLVPVEKPDPDLNLILGQSHFIKSVEDLYEALVNTVPGIQFGLAFCEASGPRLVFPLYRCPAGAVATRESARSRVRCLRCRGAGYDAGQTVGAGMERRGATSTQGQQRQPAVPRVR